MTNVYQSLLLDLCGYMWMLAVMGAIILLVYEVMEEQRQFYFPICIH